MYYSFVKQYNHSTKASTVFFSVWLSAGFSDHWPSNRRKKGFFRNNSWHQSFFHGGRWRAQPETLQCPRGSHKITKWSLILQLSLCVCVHHSVIAQPCWDYIFPHAWAKRPYTWATRRTHADVEHEWAGLDGGRDERVERAQRQKLLLPLASWMVLGSKQVIHWVW